MNLGGFGKTLDDAVGAAKPILKGNEAINSMDEFFLGGFKRLASELSGGEKIPAALKNAYSKNGDGTGGLAIGAIAGSYMTASAGYRALSGGGAYRDKNGNTNIVGVPFV